MKPKPWKVIKTKDLLVINPWLKISQEEIRLPDGSMVNDFYCIGLPDYVLIYAQNSEGKAIFTRQYKHGLKDINLALPAGYLNKRETPLAAAKRELLEETGFKANKWKFMGTFLVDGNRGCGKAHFFIADKVKKIKEPVEDCMEESDIVFMDPLQALKKTLRCKVSLLGVLALLLLALREKNL